ncbi:MAG: nucleotidyltransferase family protein [Verrucomicrobia bacterium]|nr:nucleotidyltransferase family protein [Verrucomicrobiota bacterium]
MWGIIPAAGAGSRIQPLAFSKELLPVGSRFEGATEHPRAVSEYLIDRLLAGGANKLCFVVAPNKSDILEYYGGARIHSASIAFVVQPQPAGLCDAIFRAAALISPQETVAVGLPDTIWFPEEGFCALPDDAFSFLLFPVEHPEFFDVVLTDPAHQVIAIQVKPCRPESHWVWGAFKMPGAIFHELHAFWLSRDCADEYMGTLVNAWMAKGGRAQGICAGKSYVDVGTLNGYRQALRLLSQEPPKGGA